MLAYNRQRVLASAPLTHHSRPQPSRRAQPVVETTSPTPVPAVDLSDALSSAASDGYAISHPAVITSNIPVEAEYAVTTPQPVPEQIIDTPENAAPVAPTVVRNPICPALSEAATAAIPTRSYVVPPHTVPATVESLPEVLRKHETAYQPTWPPKRLAPLKKKRFVLAKPVQPAPSTIVVQTPVRYPEQPALPSDRCSCRRARICPGNRQFYRRSDAVRLPILSRPIRHTLHLRRRLRRLYAPCCKTWEDSHPIPWSFFGPGEYAGPGGPSTYRHITFGSTI